MTYPHQRTVHARSGTESDRQCCWLGFPLVRLLPSIPSATGCPALFGDFAGTTGLSDFPCPFIIDVRPWTSRHDPQLLPLWVDMESSGSRARCVRTCMGSLTARVPSHLAISMRRVEPSASPYSVGTPGGRFNTRPARAPPCQRFDAALAGRSA